MHGFFNHFHLVLVFEIFIPPLSYSFILQLQHHIRALNLPFVLLLFLLFLFLFAALVCLLFQLFFICLFCLVLHSFPSFLHFFFVFHPFFVLFLSLSVWSHSSSCLLNVILIITGCPPDFSAASLILSCFKQMLRITLTYPKSVAGRCKAHQTLQCSICLKHFSLPLLFQ